MGDITGQKIVEVRTMTDDELRAQGWEIAIDAPGVSAPAVLVLEDGTLLYPSRDPEGNGPGALFGNDEHAAFYLG